MTNCPICGFNLIKDTRDRTLSYKGHILTITKQPGLFCDKCNEAFYSHDDLKKTALEVADFKRNTDGLLVSKELKKIRAKFKINQKVAAEIFGGGVNAFSKYERGEAIQSKPLDLLFRLLDSNKISLSDIAVTR